MQARAALMIEHRLIERMISVVKDEIVQIDATQKGNPLLIDTVVDFIHNYTDRTHHGKEEGILFRDLEKRELSSEHRDMMNGLVKEHIFARETTKTLAAANTRYRNGDASALLIIISNLRTLVQFYPKHIEKEDKVFFLAAQTYLSDEDDQVMLKEFGEFDRKMIHAKYESIVQGLGG